MKDFKGLKLGIKLQDGSIKEVDKKFYPSLVTTDGRIIKLSPVSRHEIVVLEENPHAKD